MKKKPQQKKISLQKRKLKEFYDSVDNLIDEHYNQWLLNPKNSIQPYDIIASLELLKLEFFRRHDKFVDHLDTVGMSFKEYGKKMRKEKKVKQ